MKTGFKGPLKKEQVQKKEAPWDYRAPPYDQRTSCYTNAGSHYGVGQRQPVGHKGGAAMTVEALPQGRVDTMVVEPHNVKNLLLDIQQ